MRFLFFLVVGIFSAQARFAEAPFSLTLELDNLSPEQGADIDIFSTELRASVPISIDDGNIIALTTFYQRLFYNSNGNIPFEQLSAGRVGIFTLTEINSDWDLLTLSNLRFAIEDGVSASDALTFTGLYGAWYGGWKNLLIGGGLGVVTRLDEATGIFPLIFLDWEFYDKWHITTRPTPGTRFGPGISFFYESDERWEVFFGARYISQEYQLKNDTTYEYNTARLFTTLQYALNENLFLSTTLGVNLAGEIEFDEVSTDLDPSIFTGLDLSWQF